MGSAAVDQWVDGPAPATKSGGWVDGPAPAPVDMRPRNVGTVPDEPAEKQGMLRSFYEGAIRPVVDQVTDAYKSGDFGAKAAGDVLASFTDQLKNFAGHPDIRNLPVVGPGATATADRMQKQYDAGNYRGMIGSAAAFIAPFAAPELIKSAPDAAAAVSDTAKTAAAKLRDKLPDAIPKLSGAAVDVVGMVSPRAAHATSFANRGIGVVNKILGTTKSAAPLSPSQQILADMRASNARLDAEDAAYARLPATPPEDPPPAAPPAAAAAAPLPVQPGAFNQGAGAPAAAGPWTQYAPAQRQATAEDFARAPVDPNAQPVGGAVAPELTAAQKLEDAADEQAARLQHQAEDILWANRARKADRFAEYLKQQKLDPTTENIAAAAKTLGERGIPSDETVPMIHDRMGYTEPAAESTPDLEQQLVDSIAAVKAKAAAPTDSEALFAKSKAAFDAAKAATDPAPLQLLNARRPIVAMARQDELPPSSWIMPDGKVETLNRAAGETHGDALTRLKVKGDPFEKGLIRQVGDAIQLNELSNRHLPTAMYQAAEHARGTTGEIWIQLPGKVIEVPVDEIEYFLKRIGHR